MSKTGIYKLDDFWKDCISDPYNKPKINKVLNANKKNKAQNVKSIKTFFNDNTQNIYIRQMKNLSKIDNDEEINFPLKQMSKNNRKNIKEALIKENLMPLIENKKKEKVIQKCIDIYNKDKISKDLKIKNNEKQKLKKEKLKVEECTFKPEKWVNKKIEKKN